MTLSIIIINYQSRKYLEKCLKSIGSFANDSTLDFEVIVINNDPVFLKLERKYPFISRILNLTQNVGFGRANNVGAKCARGDILLFLNPDVIFEDDSIKKALKYFSDYENIGALGPKIIEAKTKKPQPWTSGKKTTLASILFRNTINKPWNKNHEMFVDWISGTALFVKKDLFEEIGGFDEKFFMYFEDQDLCLRIKKLNKNIVFFPKTKVIHFNGKSWQNDEEKKKAFYESQKYFFQKHASPISYQLFKIIRIIAKGL